MNLNLILAFHHNSLLENIARILEVLAWPIVLFVVFLILKEPIKNFFNRIKSIGYKGAGIETVTPKKQSDDRESPIEKLRKENPNEYLEKIKSYHAPETFELFKEAIIKESRVDTFEKPEEREKVLYTYSQLLYLTITFNKIYSSIYGSQINILQRLNSSVFETKESLKSYYEFAKSSFPKTYEKYSYDKYMNYLIRFGLIFEEGSEIKITILGKDFLRYIVESGYPFYKLY